MVLAGYMRKSREIFAAGRWQSRCLFYALFLAFPVIPIDLRGNLIYYRPSLPNDNGYCFIIRNSLISRGLYGYSFSFLMLFDKFSFTGYTVLFMCVFGILSFKVYKY